MPIERSTVLGAPFLFHSLRVKIHYPVPDSTLAAFAIQALHWAPLNE